MAFFCAKRGVPVCRCWPPASPSSRAALSLGFTCFFFVASLVAFLAAHPRPACAPCSSLRYTPCRPVPSPPVTPFSPSSPPIRCHSEGPVCTFPFALTAFALHSPVCATRVVYPCPSPLSLPLSLVSCRTLTLPSLLCCRPLSLCFAFIRRLSPLPERHGFMVRGGGFTCGLDCGPARGRVGRRIVWIRRSDFPHAACTSELPMGSTVANAILLGLALRAGNVGAQCHLWPFVTVTTPR